MTDDGALSYLGAVAAQRAALLLERGELGGDESPEVLWALIILLVQRHNALVASVRGVSHGFLRVGPLTDPQAPRAPKPALLLSSEELPGVPVGQGVAPLSGTGEGG